MGAKHDTLTLAVDFDGTCVEHEYPVVGDDVPKAVHTLRLLIEEGHKLVLNTMRSGRPLADAVEWFRDRELPLFGVNNNPTQASWTSSPKVYAHLYIDDAAVGCPLVYPKGKRPYVDWPKVYTIINQRKFKG